MFNFHIQTQERNYASDESPNILDKSKEITSNTGKRDGNELSLSTYKLSDVCLIQVII